MAPHSEHPARLDDTHAASPAAKRHPALVPLLEPGYRPAADTPRRAALSAQRRYARHTLTRALRGSLKLHIRKDEIIRSKSTLSATDVFHIPSSLTAPMEF